MGIVVFLLVVIAGVLAVPFVLLARRRARGTGTSAAEVITYLILIAATLVAVNALSSLLKLVVPGGEVIVGGTEELALSLSTLIVAGVVAVVVWITLERRTVLGKGRATRDLYLSVVIGVSMAIVAAALVSLGEWAIGSKEFVADDLIDLVIFGGAWLLHERLRRPPEELDEIRQLAGSFIGLTLSVTALSVVFNGSISAIVEASRVIAGGEGLWESIRSGVALGVVGFPFWWWFWLRGLVGRVGPWRNAFALSVALLSWITAFVSLATVLNLIAQGIFGLATDTSAHYAALPEALTGFIVGGLIYWHHRAVLGRPRTNAVRIVEYSLGGFGLVVGSGALVVLAATAFENLVRSGRSLLVDDVRVTVAALIVLSLAAMTVARYWVSALRLSTDAAEVASAPRKGTVLILLIGFFFTGAGALIALLFYLLRAALEGNTRGLGEELDWVVPLVLVSAAMCWHLARVRRAPVTTAIASPGAPPASGQVTTGAPPVRVGIVTVVASDPGPLPSLLPGMRFLRRVDGAGTVDQAVADRIMEALAGVSAQAALVTVDENGFSVVPLA